MSWDRNEFGGFLAALAVWAIIGTAFVLLYPPARHTVSDQLAAVTNLAPSVTPFTDVVAAALVSVCLVTLFYALRARGRYRRYRDRRRGELREEVRRIRRHDFHDWTDEDRRKEVAALDEDAHPADLEAAAGEERDGLHLRGKPSIWARACVVRWLLGRELRDMSWRDIVRLYEAHLDEPLKQARLLRQLRRERRSGEAAHE